VEGVRFRDVLFEEAPIDFFLHPIEQRIKSGLDVANKTKINGVRRPYASGSCQFELFSL